MENHYHEFSLLRTMNVLSPFPQETGINQGSPSYENHQWLEDKLCENRPRSAGSPAVAVALATRWHASPQKRFLKLESWDLPRVVQMESWLPLPKSFTGLNRVSAQQKSEPEIQEKVDSWQFPCPASGRNTHLPMCPCHRECIHT